MRVLVVDDHPHVRELLQRSLERDGHEVAASPDVSSARRWLAENDAHIIILDLGLPDGNGIELCRSLRDGGCATPILLLTAQGEVSTRVAGLDAGADDFLAKPFALAELRARVRAIARRGALRQNLRFEQSDLEIDFEGRRAFRARSEVALTAREWAILELLRQRDGRIVTRDDLLANVWGSTAESAGKSLEVLIGRIRRKLGDSVVRTIRGEGYAFGQ